MRKVALLLLAGWTASAFAAGQVNARQIRAARQVTVEQLESILTAAAGKSDRKEARQLYNLELTDRLSEARLAHAEGELPGPASRSALRMVADEAEFLDLPAGDLPAIAPSDHAAQVLILGQTVGYLAKTLPELPNFLATETTIRFATPPLSELRLMGPWTNGFPVHPVGSFSATVLYRDGHELQENKTKKRDSTRLGLRTDGEFGPILSTVLVDAIAHGRITWSHWENGASGRMAVFGYTVAKEVSHYSVADPESKQEVLVAYHGQIAVNPLDGSILRITMMGDFNPASLQLRADLMVDYGPNEIGGKTYICPVKSVALSAAWPPDHLLDRGEDARGDLLRGIGINETRFTHYHLFRAEIHILSGDGIQPESSSAAPEPGGASSATPGTPPHP